MYKLTFVCLLIHSKLNYIKLELLIPTGMFTNLFLSTQVFTCNNNRKSSITTVFPRLERARSINFRLAPRGVVFEGAL